MKYQVFEEDRPADCFHCKVHTSWDNSIFESFEEACKYAIYWAYPYNKAIINDEYETYWKNIMKPNIPIDMGQGEFPVMITIKEVI